MPHLCHAFQDCFWTQNINFATRKDPGSGAESLLDPCLSSTPDLVLAAESHGWFSDHSIYSVDLVRPSSRNCSVELVPDWRRADLDKLAANLSNVNWSEELQHLSGLDSWELIKKKIDEETDACAKKEEKN